MTATIHQISNIVKRARNAGAPLLGINTADQFAAIGILRAGLNDAATLQWDCVRGLKPLSKAGAEWLAKAGLQDPLQAADPVVALDVLLSGMAGGKPLPTDGCVFMLNAHKWLTERPVLQAVANVRDSFKLDGRTLVLLGPDLRLPIELSNDVLVYDEALPNEQMTRELISAQFENVGLPAPAESEMALALDSVIGLNAFAIEQVTALCLSKAGLDVSEMWARKRAIISQTRGLSVWGGGETLDQMGGNAGIKADGKALCENPAARPRVIVWLDEVEKTAAGAKGDLSGVSDDAKAVLLSDMQDTKAAGMMLVGLPGSGKSMFAKALGASYGIPVIRFDLGAMQGSLVGESQQMVRAAMAVVNAIGQGKVLWIATSNDISKLPAEFVERFWVGTYFFDLPTHAERETIWTLKCAEYGVNVDQPRPNDEGMVGRNIEAVVRKAATLRRSLVEAALSVVPFAEAHPNVVQRLREQADGHYLSASQPGIYRTVETPAVEEPVAAPATIKAGARKLTVN